MGTEVGNEAAPARERILATAGHLFYEEGIRATGIDRVIAEASVTKVTFYRHFPSKNDLILAYLERRHHTWLQWFRDSLQRHGGGEKALVLSLEEWFSGRAEVLGPFRGCAFLNGVGEVGPALPGVVEITRRHKRDMADAIADGLPASTASPHMAAAIAQAVDGAILQAQYTGDPAKVLALLAFTVDRLLKARPGR